MVQWQTVPWMEIKIGVTGCQTHYLELLEQQLCNLLERTSVPQNPQWAVPEAEHKQQQVKWQTRGLSALIYITKQPELSFPVTWDRRSFWFSTPLSSSRPAKQKMGGKSDTAVPSCNPNSEQTQLAELLEIQDQFGLQNQTQSQINRSFLKSDKMWIIWKTEQHSVSFSHCLNFKVSVFYTFSVVTW